MENLPENTKKPTLQPEIQTANTLNPSIKAPNYNATIVVFSIGVVCLLISELLLRNIRSSAGHSGSEAEIVVLPIQFVGGIIIAISFVMFLITIMKRIKYDVKSRQIDKKTNIL